MTQPLAPRWWEIQLPVDLDLHYLLTATFQHGKWHSHRHMTVPRLTRKGQNVDGAQFLGIPALSPK